MRELPQESDRRRHRRHMCSELVEVRFHDQNGREVRHTGLLEEVCVGGMQLSVSLPLSPGKRVLLRAEGFESEADVRHCRPETDGFRVGFQFPPGSEWNSRVWRPRHLLVLPFDE